MDGLKAARKLGLRFTGLLEGKTRGFVAFVAAELDRLENATTFRIRPGGMARVRKDWPPMW